MPTFPQIIRVFTLAMGNFAICFASPQSLLATTQDDADAAMWIAGYYGTTAVDLYFETYDELQVEHQLAQDIYYEIDDNDVKPFGQAQINKINAILQDEANALSSGSYSLAGDPHYPYHSAYEWIEIAEYNYEQADVAYSNEAWGVAEQHANRSATYSNYAIEICDSVQNNEIPAIVSAQDNLWTWYYNWLGE